MNIIFTPTSWEQYTDWQKEDKKIVKRINELTRDEQKKRPITTVVKFYKICTKKF